MIKSNYSTKIAGILAYTILLNPLCHIEAYCTEYSREFGVIQHWPIEHKAYRVKPNTPHGLQKPITPPKMGFLASAHPILEIYQYAK
jgi:hypothetical protein